MAICNAILQEVGMCEKLEGKVKITSKKTELYDNNKSKSLKKVSSKELVLMLREELSFLIKRLSLITSSVVGLDDEVDNIVKLLGETECPVSQWCERMFLSGGLTRLYPVRADIPMT